MKGPGQLTLDGRVADFCLSDEAGEIRCLRDVLGNGPVLLWVFRGHA